MSNVALPSQELDFLGEPLTSFSKLSNAPSVNSLPLLWGRELDNSISTPKSPIIFQIKMVEKVLIWTLESGLPLPRVEQDDEDDDILTLTWRELNFDLFINLTDDGEMFGYYRQRRLNGIEVDSVGEDLNSEFDIRICIKNIGANFMPTVLESTVLDPFERLFSSINVSA